MPSRRYILPMPPVEHINGKLTNTAIKCENSTEGGTLENGIFYGYRHKNSNRNFFGVRIKRRNLTLNPYTNSEILSRSLFSLSSQEAAIHLQNPAEKALCKMDYLRQDKYRTLRGFAITAVMLNGGTWLQDWTVQP